MPRTRRVQLWPIDPDRVRFATVTPPGGRGVQTSYVLVQYEGETTPGYVPLGTFLRRTRMALDIGRLLGIERLCVSPKCYGRYRDFFDRLTDWSRARRRVLDAAREEKLRARLRTRPRPETTADGS